ncbi:hypothetical protein DFH27DRAFT_476742 [Peziza echinospora]|nr:hypothetical protein DFH27DRAFT_476742 [Peziza echinospora]
MPPLPHAKPENVLKRAQELCAVGKDQAALELLHEHVASKRSRNAPIASLEPVMILFVELCVSLRKGKPAKDGLYQYKNIAQNTSVKTIEVVLKRFIELAEQKVTEAQEKATQMTETVDDLEATETPESILLSTVSGEQSKDRTDRVVVTPWLKFLWETYRTVLDILRNNARLEVMYQSTALQAFQFCLKYIRKTEFRRLCELLRTHVQNATKYSTQMHAINLSDPDTLQRHLDTRFQQLNVAVELELWQEAFRSVEDIHTLLSLSKRPPKAIMMANYYEKLTRIFLVSENYLFHAAAWNRYYNLLRQSAASVAAGASHKRDAPTTTESDVTRAASFVLLSALAIPVISTSRSRGALLDVDEAKKNKNTRLTNLLGMGKAPTRGGLFKDALSKGLLKRAKPEIRDLYTILEVDFHPLSICQKISPILTQIAEDPEMKRYIQPLHQVILTRLFQQLSQVYETVSLEFVINLATFPAPFEVTPATIEKFIMNGCKKGDLPIRIDHAAGVLTFESDVFSSSKPLHPGSGSSADKETSVQKLQSTPSEIVRTQLSRLAKALYLTCNYVDPSFTQEREDAKAAALARAAAGAEKEHKETLARRVIIEKKKEAAENAILKKEKEEAHIKLLRQKELTEAENTRLAEQAKQREAARIKADQDRIRHEELLKQFEELKATGKLDVDVADLDDMDTNRLREMKLQQLEKEKRDMAERLRITGKRIDHLERAYRKEELKLLPVDLEAQRQADLQAYEARNKAILDAAERKHADDVALKRRLARLVVVYETFRDEVHERRHEEFEQRRIAAEAQLKTEIAKRKKAVRERKEREAREREEEERRLQEEEERAAKEEEERAAKEAADRERMAAEKAEREEQRKKLDEIAAIQRQREEEAEARRAAKKAEARHAPEPVAAPVAPAAAADSDTAPPARWRPADKPAGGMSWREREALKQAQIASGEIPAPAAAAPPAAAPVAAAAPAASASLSERPRLNLAKPSADRLQERERAFERAPERIPERAIERAVERETPERTASPAAAGGPTKYVPPSRRGGAEPPAASTPPPPAAEGSEKPAPQTYRAPAYRRGGGLGGGMSQGRGDAR